MPAAVAYVAGHVAAWVFNAAYAGLTYLGVSASTAVLISGYAASLAVVGVYATAYLAPALFAPRPEQPSIESARQTENQTRAPRRWGLGGSQRLGGTRLLFASIRGHGLEAIYHCEGPVASITRAWLHDDEVTLDPVTGLVQGLADGAYGEDRISLHAKTGAPGQTAIAELVAVAGDLWTSAHRAVGCALTGVIFRKTADDEITKLYPRGRPRVSRLVTFTAYDFRKDSTVPGGVGGHRRDQPETWEPCANPVVCFIHNELHRYGASWERRFLPTLEVNRAEADYCDTPALKYDGGTEALYEIHGSYTARDDRAAVRRWFLECMDGSLFKRPDGSIEVRAGRYTAPGFTLPVRHIVSLRKTTGVQIAARLNVLTGSFCSPAHGWTEQEATAFRDEDDIAVRGEVADSLPMTLVASHDQWRRLAYRRWLRRRMGEQLTVVTDLWGLNWDGSRWITLPPIPGGPPSLATETEWEVLGVRKRWPLQVEFTLAKSTGPAIDAPLTGDLAQPGPGVTPRPDRVGTPTPAILSTALVDVGGLYVIQAVIDPAYLLGLAGNRFAIRWRRQDGAAGPDDGWTTGASVLAPSGSAPLTLQTTALATGVYEVQPQAVVGGSPSDWGATTTVNTSLAAPASPVGLFAFVNADTTPDAVVQCSAPASPGVDHIRFFQGGASTPFNAATDIGTVAATPGALVQKTVIDPPSGGYRFWAVAETAANAASPPAGPASVTIP